jgi:hypothetical protein
MIYQSPSKFSALTDETRPVSAYWTYPSPTAANCIDDALALKISGILNTSAEFLIAVLPLIAIYRLQVKRPWSVICLLSLGFSVVVVGCFRTYYIFKATQLYDWTWWSAAQWICSEVENNTAIVMSHFYSDIQLVAFFY